VFAAAGSAVDGWCLAGFALAMALSAFLCPADQSPVRVGLPWRELVVAFVSFDCVGELFGADLRRQGLFPVLCGDVVQVCLWSCVAGAQCAGCTVIHFAWGETLDDDAAKDANIRH